MSPLESISPESTADIEDLARSMTVIRNAGIESPRRIRARVRPDHLGDVQEIEPVDRQFVDHTDSLEQIRSVRREIVNQEKPGGGGPEDFPDPYYTPNP